MAIAWIDAQPDAVAGRHGAQLAQHVDGAAIDFDLGRRHARQGGAVEQVAGEHQAGGAVGLRRRKACLQRALDLAQRDGVHVHARFAHQGEQMDI